MFDVLWIDRWNITALPLEPRRTIPKPPFTTGTGLPRLRVHWAKPEVVVQLSFLEWTGEGHNAKLRHSRLIGIRTDKLPREVVRERA